eukprot:jgi/Chlat1/3925/Chrsp26S04189
MARHEERAPNAAPPSRSLLELASDRLTCELRVSVLPLAAAGGPGGGQRVMDGDDGLVLNLVDSAPLAGKKGAPARPRAKLPFHQQKRLALVRKQQQQRRDSKQQQPVVSSGLTGRTQPPSQATTHTPLVKAEAPKSSFAPTRRAVIEDDDNQPSTSRPAQFSAQQPNSVRQPRIRTASIVTTQQDTERLLPEANANGAKLPLYKKRARSVKHSKSRPPSTQPAKQQAVDQDQVNTQRPHAESQTAASKSKVAAKSSGATAPLRLAAAQQRAPVQLSPEAAARTFAATTFQELGLAAPLADMGLPTPTHVQKSAIPSILTGKDTLVHADTGTGKTLTYLAPIMNYLQDPSHQITRADGTYALVVAPTRELCLQIVGVLSLMCKRFHYVVAGCILGGENKAKEKARLRKGLTVVVATPGRLLDHLQNTKAFNTHNLRFLVLDEADRLLDMGFEKDVLGIVSILEQRQKGQRQTMLLSATLPAGLRSLATSNKQLQNGSDAEDLPGVPYTADEEFTVPSQLSQSFVQGGSVCLQLRRVRVPPQAIYFFLDWRVTTLAASTIVQATRKPQSERADAFFAFVKASSGVLVSTDVAARGLDFPAVTCIVQYDPPGEASDYVHRVGRTARAGQTGEAVLFLQPHEMEYIKVLHKQGVELQEIQLQDVMMHAPGAAVQRGKQRRQVTLDSDDSAFTIARQLEAFVSSRKELLQLAIDAFRSFIRAYAVHPGALKKIFHVKQLHLGHVAHSLGLKKQPSTLGMSSTKVAMKRKRTERIENFKRKGKRLRPAREVS